MDDSYGYGTNIIMFTSYISLWTGWTLLIKFAKGDGDTYPFEFVTVILLTEIFKFVLTLVLYFFNGPLDEIPRRAREMYNQASAGLYCAIPAFTYLLYNLLLFYNLIYFDPVSYRVLINIRILWSGLLFQIFFSKYLGWQKWIALIVLVISCGVNQINAGFQVNSMWFLLSICFQAFTSSFGGVYTEFLLKKDIDLSIHLKNAYLYGFSIIFNVIFICVTKPDLLFAADQRFFNGYSTSTWLIIGLGVLCGFSTALFLKYLNIILKEYAHSGELLSTAVCTYLFFNADLGWNVILSVVLVSVSVLLYNGAIDLESFFQSPLDTKTKASENV